MISGKFRIVDVSPDLERKITIRGNYDLSALLARIELAVTETNAKRVVIDSISTLFTQFPDTVIVRNEMYRIVAALKRMNVTSIITAERNEEYGCISRFGVEEFVADNVIILRNILNDEKCRRTMQILKYCGATNLKGEFSFTVSDNGIEVICLNTMRLTMNSSVRRIGSGNKDIDKMCGGGFFRDSIILLSGATGTGKTLLVTTLLNDGCLKGEKTLLFAFEESRQQLFLNAIGWGMDFRKWEEKGLLKIVCDYPVVIGLTDHFLRMKEEIDRFQPGRIAIDSL